MLTLIDPDQALRLVLEAAPAPHAVDLPLARAGGLILAEDVRADRDHPPFDRAMMDGYAVAAGDAGRTVEVVGEVAAGQRPTVRVAPGRCVRIMTGAPCPEGAEAVVKKEQAAASDDGARVTLPAPLAAGRHIAPRGCERAAGELALRAGTRLTALGAAVLAALGRSRVRVLDPPDLAIVVTGSELVEPGQTPGAAQIHNSNGPMLAAQAARLGLPAPRLLRAADTLESLAGALHACEEVAIVVLCGGVSMGEYDLVPAALQAHGAELIFHKVTQKPGKPLLLARRGGQLLLGLPGNPLSSHLCFHRYVAAAARQAMGLPVEDDQELGVLAADLRTRAGRTQFLLARAERIDDAWRLHGRPGRGSADIFAGVDADAYLRLPPGEHHLRAGDTIAFSWIGQRR